MAANWRARRARCRTGYQTQSISKAREEPAAIQLFNFQWLARSAARSLFLLFTYGSRRRLFINQTFFEQSPIRSMKEIVAPMGQRNFHVVV